MTLAQKIHAQIESLPETYQAEVLDFVEFLRQKASLAEDEAQPTAYERLKPYIGISDSGGRQLSERTGMRLREQLEEQQRARRPG